MYFLFYFIFFIYYGLIFFYFDLGYYLFILILDLNYYKLFFLLILLVIFYLIIFFGNFYMNYYIYYYYYFFLMLIFLLSMFFLLLSSSFLFLIFTWDMLGLSSFFLVLFYGNSDSISGSLVTVLTNRIGDYFLLMFIFLSGLFLNKFMLFMNYMFFFLLELISITKSAQFPFMGWLPKAMSAPTPVSSLVHSSTLVTAGCFLLMHYNYFINFNFYFLIIILSLFTIIFSSIMSFFELDFKKIIALSTLSQIGLCFFSFCLGFYFICLLHLLSHAIFKSVLFMQTGYLIYYSFSQQDLRLYNFYDNMYLYLKVQIMVSLFCLCGLMFYSGMISKHYLLEFFYTINLGFFLLLMVFIMILMTFFYCYKIFFSFFNFNYNFNYLNFSFIYFFLTLMLIFFSLFLIYYLSYNFFFLSVMFLYLDFYLIIFYIVMMMMVFFLFFNYLYFFLKYKYLSDYYLFLLLGLFYYNFLINNIFFNMFLFFLNFFNFIFNKINNLGYYFLLVFLIIMIMLIFV
uniref:NADH:ubiquinone reductase (H(+)-translocating) n=1 Tax=Radopholus similis TaxID=46012 RepID=C7TQP4_RADSI|nr:NADH dehydrogenase subunit 5 [Radopholus similis]